MAKPMRKDKPINTTQVIEYLGRAFEAASTRFDNRKSKVVRGTQLYQYQVDFAYLLNEIKLGPVGLVPKVISDANALIVEMQNVEVVETE